MFAGLLFFAVIVATQKEIYPNSSKLIFNAPRPLDIDSLFGYSIAYLPHSDKDKKSLIITAPKANEVGEIFKCGFTTMECSRVETNLTNPDTRDASHLLLGVKVQAGSSFFVTCAPRALYSPLRNVKQYYVYAKCYYYNSSTESIRLAQELSEERKHWDILKHFDPKDIIRWGPSGNSDLEAYKLGFDHKRFPIQFRFDSFGWSMEVFNDKTVLIGGPAMIIGRVMVYRNGFDTMPELISVDNKEFAKTNGRVEYNFGYSITSGKFFLNKWTYAVSTPYGEIGKGKVLFFDTNLQYIKATIVDDDVGSMFGAALCPANLSDGGSMLLVGAPAWTRTASDSTPLSQVGAVHVYVAKGPNEDALSWKRYRTISEFKHNSYFGSDIVNLGDLDGDGKDEIAIAAPYEHGGHGAVYIYSGAELLKNAKEQEILPFIQKITGEAPTHNLGLGISALKDVDENGCNELAIGVPGAKQVILLRCMASVTVTLKVANYRALEKDIKAIKGIQDGKTFIELNQCLYVEYNDKPKNIKTEIEVNTDVSDNMKIAAEDQTFIAHLKDRLQIYCKAVKLLFYEKGDYDKPIEVKLTSKILNAPNTFDADTVVFSERSVDTFSLNLTPPGSNLRFAMYTTMKQSYLIGSTSKEALVIKVENHGNFAQNWCLRAHIEGVKVANFTNECNLSGQGEVVCFTPLGIQEEVVNRIFLDTESMTTASEKILMQIKLFKICNETSSLINAENRTVLLTFDDNIKAVGKSTPRLNVTKADLELGEQKVSHYYEIINEGITHWKGINYYISLPSHVNTMVNTSGDCVVKKNEAKCAVEDLPRNSSAYIVVSMSVIPGAKLRHFPKSMILTQLNFVAGKSIIVSVDTPITILDKPVPLWVMIVASIVGLAILLIIALILRECGCLKRKNKEILRKLKQEVKRQSQIRMSTRIRDSRMPSHLEACDRERLVAISEDEDSSPPVKYQKHNPKNRVLPDLPAKQATN